MRYPAVAGQFYAGTRSGLLRQIEDCYTHRLGPGKVPKLKISGRRLIKGGVVPHAGYEYSGPIAAHVFNALAEDGFPKSFVVIGGHPAYGEAVITTETFVTPLGEISVDKDLAKNMDLEENQDVHAYEHAIEVQLPFLQHLKPDIKFVPICVPSMDVKLAEEVGRKIAKAVNGKDVVILASTDFTHAGPNYDQLPPRNMRVDEFVKKRDKVAIKAILELSPTRLFEEIENNEISVCGAGSVAAMLFALEKMAKSAELLKYATSYDIWPANSAVGYGAIVIR
ncbi:MAG: AmmeMemoRadiSam system protein B [Hadesarchaea archaeon CG08_land_8_20_14_0_20_51_8]|nr:MAG: AmmeMemoRadiSam system protein B [Hadesarchaea archaeon CG08_land_8_20_14_0_20_51_8]